MVAVDEFEIGDPVRPRSTTGETPRRRRRRGPRGPAAWVAAALALVAVGVGTAGPTLAVGGEPSGVAHGLADVDLSAPPDVTWYADLGLSLVVGGTDEVLVVRTFAWHNVAPEAIVAVDRRTGEARWRHTDDGSCQVGAVSAGCVEAVGAPSAVVVTIDLADGTERREPHPEALAALPVDGGTVVVEEAAGDEEVVLLRQDDGRERWRVRADAAAVGRATPMSATDDALVLELTGQTLDLATGEPDGAPLEVLETEVPFDDDVRGPVALTTAGDGAVVAQARVSGRELWRTEGACGVLARVGGRVLVADGCALDAPRTLTVLAERTGEPLWSARCTCAALAASAGGAVVLSGWDGSPLGAVDLATGATLWTVRVPAGTDVADLAPVPVMGGFAAAGGDGVVHWGWGEPARG